MMDSLRCPSPTRRSAATQVPAPLGPRWVMVSRIAVMYPSLMENRLFLTDSAPTIPHIMLYLDSRLELFVSGSTSLQWENLPELVISEIDHADCLSRDPLSWAQRSPRLR